ncbi:hypothetical protein C0J52_01330 [Blattella germanica]|nr:hypothetical protein C0J52_01330 [Blattella germanica]
MSSSPPPPAMMAADMMAVGNMTMAAGNMMPDMCMVETLNFATIFLILINSIANSKTQNSGRVQQLQAATDVYDFIIVGGGSAGCVLANSFCPYLKGNMSGIDWNLRTQPEVRACGGQGCDWPRGRVLGGSSVLNGMLYVRGHRQDYDHWAAVGNTGWSYNETLPYFIKSENNLDPQVAADTTYHGTGGPLPVQTLPYQDINVRALIAAFQEIGYRQLDFNGQDQEGVMRAQTTTRNGERISANSAYIKPIRRSRTNLRIITNATVTRIIIDASKRATGVQFVLEEDRNTTLTATASKEVIVSAGAVHSPHILSLSGVGPREFLEPLGIPVVSDLSVGYNLQDHVSSGGVYYTLTDTAQVPNINQRMDHLLQYIREGNGPLSATGVLQVNAFGRSQYARAMGDYPDIQWVFDSEVVIRNLTTGFTTPLTANGTVPPGATCTVAPITLEPFCYYNHIIPRPTLLRPRSRGLIKLNTTNPFDPPLIYPNYFSDPPDMQILIEGLLLAVRLSQTSVLRNMRYSLDITPVPGCEGFRTVVNMPIQLTTTEIPDVITIMPETKTQPGDVFSFQEPTTENFDLFGFQESTTESDELLRFQEPTTESEELLRFQEPTTESDELLRFQEPTTQTADQLRLQEPTTETPEPTTERVEFLRIQETTTRQPSDIFGYGFEETTPNDISGEFFPFPDFNTNESPSTTFPPEITTEYEDVLRFFLTAVPGFDENATPAPNFELNQPTTTPPPPALTTIAPKGRREVKRRTRTKRKNMRPIVVV